MIKKFTKIETLFATFLVSIPLILMLVSWEIRPSISNYAYSSAKLWYSGLLSIASAVFIYNGMVKTKWYNVVLGISIFIIGVTRHEHQPILHFSSAGLFFLGSVFVMAYYSSTKQRFYKLIAGAFILFAMMLHFVFDIWSLLVAEWIGLAPISLHFIGESNNIID